MDASSLTFAVQVDVLAGQACMRVRIFALAATCEPQTGADAHDGTQYYSSRTAIGKGSISAGRLVQVPSHIVSMGGRDSQQQSRREEEPA